MEAYNELCPESASSAIIQTGRPGGISLEGIKVDTTPTSNPVNISVFNLQDWKSLTFQIIDLRPILDLTSYLGVTSYEEKKGIGYFEEINSFHGKKA